MSGQRSRASDEARVDSRAPVVPTTETRRKKPNTRKPNTQAPKLATVSLLVTLISARP